jgi:hypothetical protein
MYFFAAITVQCLCSLEIPSLKTQSLNFQCRDAWHQARLPKFSKILPVLHALATYSHELNFLPLQIFSAETMWQVHPQ